MELGELHWHPLEDRTPAPRVNRGYPAHSVSTRHSQLKHGLKGARHDHQTQSRPNISAAPLPAGAEARDMTSFDHLTKNGGAHHLAQHFGHPDTTVVGGERYIIREPDTPAADRRFPDLLIAFDATLRPTKTATATSYPSRASRPTS